MTSPNTTYLALTIGPIEKASEKARSTRGLWAASFLFSAFMRSVCRQLTYKGFSFVIPYLDPDGKIFDPHGGAGLFPDRLIVKAKAGDESVLLEVVNTAISELIDKQTTWKINERLPLEQKRRAIGHEITPLPDTETLRQHFRRFLKLRAVSFSVPVSKNPVEVCYPILTALEFMPTLAGVESADWLDMLFQAIHETPVAKQDLGTGGRFPSLIEIATCELESEKWLDYQAICQSALNESRKKTDEWLKKGKDEEEPTEEDNLLELLRKKARETRNRLRRYHSYIAIVKADGDNMGKTLAAVGLHTPALLNSLQQALFEFNQKAIPIISQQGGRAIFLGGDDLLFFAPVLYKSQSVFDLVNRLHEQFTADIKPIYEQFKAKVVTVSDIPDCPTLSFGISISYHKYPLFEALETAKQLLEDTKTGQKNAVAFRLLKHSGSYFGEQFSQADGSFKRMCSLLDAIAKPVKQEEEEEKARFLSSVQFRIRELSPLLQAIANKEGQLKAFFDNQFNEAIHHQMREFIDLVWQTIHETYKLQANSANAWESTLHTVYSSLRMAQFLTQPDSSDEND
ncbi:type III-B CRISPR-associated protein Cas10/Cmr2 [Larkinella sp. VNQ87]|uniref:type III-B CRISPR-associated protein Cas10/Cmr2 n=1 Tax=Larkinella sp. VNQ87 TaxID=3400921 RepID=UPI003BFED5E4